MAELAPRLKLALLPALVLSWVLVLRDLVLPLPGAECFHKGFRAQRKDFFSDNLS